MSRDPSHIFRQWVFMVLRKNRCQWTPWIRAHFILRANGPLSVISLLDYSCSFFPFLGTYVARVLFTWMFALWNSSCTFQTTSSRRELEHFSTANISQIIRGSAVKDLYCTGDLLVNMALNNIWGSKWMFSKWRASFSITTIDQHELQSCYIHLFYFFKGRY